MRPKGSARLQKWPFLLGDVSFLIVAAAIGLIEERPWSETTMIIMFSCVFLGTALAIFPFVTDHVSTRQEDLIEAREQLEELAQKLSESADYIGTVSGQFQSINDATIKAVHLAESLPYKMQEKVGEIAQSIQQGQDEEKEAMAAELEELRENESRHLESAIDKARASLDAAVKRVEAAEKALVIATAALEAHAKSAPATPAAETAVADAPAKSPPPQAAKKKENPVPAVDPPAAAEEEPAPVESPKEVHGKAHAAPKAKEHAKPAKHEKPANPPAAKESPKTEKIPEPEKEEAPPSPPPRKKVAKPADHEILPGLDPVVVRDDESDDGDGGAAKTSDGSTRLLVTAYIGIGNKVYARGEGPGLSADKGQPLEFVSIGKWLWQTSEATAPVTIQLYKNDEVKALGDDITIDPGYHVEATPVFKDPNPF